MKNSYYTYAYLREDGTPYYIGKGKGRRAYKVHRKVRPPKDEKRILILKKGLSEEEAFKHEVYMIAILGRKDLGTGVLRNLTDGGEGTSGRVTSEETKRKIGEVQKGRSPSEETRKKLSEANKGKNNHNYGKNLSEETRRKLSEAHKGRVHSEEARRKIGEASRGRVISDETRRKKSEANKGKNNPNYGKTPSEETRRKLSEAHKGRVHSEEARRKISEAKRNISEETRRKLSQASKGKSNHNYGKKWWCHPVEKSVVRRENPGPEWQNGRKWKE